MSGDFDFGAVAWTGWLVGRINEFRFCLKADLTSLASRRPHLPIYTTATVGTVLPTTAGFAQIAGDAAECPFYLFANPGRSRVPQTVVHRTPAGVTVARIWTFRFPVPEVQRW